VTLEAKRDATGYDDIGPGEKGVRDRVREQLKQDLERKAERETERLQTKATQELERKLEELQPELGQVVNKITRDALKQKAAQMGTVKEIAEDAETGNLTIKVEV
jgi:F0F1-type ATP synthase membrane subunit b/b'